MISNLFHQFVNDDKVRALVLLVAADFMLGVVAALKLGTFKLSYVGDVLKTDVLGKLFPFFVLWSINAVNGGAQLVIGGVTFQWVYYAAYGIFVAALAGSLTSSLSDLGVKVPTKGALGKLNLISGEKAPT